MDFLDKLYVNYNILSDSKDITSCESNYLEIISAVQGSSNEKRLASQFICKFFKHFPNLYDEALNSLFDLCEDADVEIRKQVIKDLPTVCKDNEDNIPKITDILCQLLVTDDTTELQIIHLSLINLCRISPKLFLTGLFAQIETGEEIIKERAINFLQNKLKTLPPNFWSKENEEFFLTSCKKILTESTKEEFKIFMSFLLNLKICKRITGQQILLNIINQNAHLEQGIDINDNESIENFLFYLKYAMLCFSSFVCSNVYVEFICIKIIDKLFEYKEQNEIVFLIPVLNALGEISIFVQPENKNNLINLSTCKKIIFNKLLHYLPEPKLIKEDINIIDETSTEKIDYKFELIEPLMLTLHNFGKKNSENFIEEIGGNDIFKDFKLRLQQLARSCQDKCKTLQTATRFTKNATMSPKLIALKCVQNINSIIKDMFYLKPKFKTQLVPSWKTANISNLFSVQSNIISYQKDNKNDAKETQDNKKEVILETSLNTKRKLITAPEKDASDLEKKIKKPYTPPVGKYTSKNNFKNFVGRNNQKSTIKGQNQRFKINRKW